MNTNTFDKRFTAKGGNTLNFHQFAWIQAGYDITDSEILSVSHNAEKEAEFCGFYAIWRD